MWRRRIAEIQAGPFVETQMAESKVSTCSANLWALDARRPFATESPSLVLYVRPREFTGITTKPRTASHRASLEDVLGDTSMTTKPHGVHDPAEDRLREELRASLVMFLAITAVTPQSHGVHHQDEDRLGKNSGKPRRCSWRYLH
jgi:hypothetical protein